MLRSFRPTTGSCICMLRSPRPSRLKAAGVRAEVSTTDARYANANACLGAKQLRYGIPPTSVRMCHGKTLEASPSAHHAPQLTSQAVPPSQAYRRPMPRRPLRKVLHRESGKVPEVATWTQGMLHEQARLKVEFWGSTTLFGSRGGVTRNFAIRANHCRCDDCSRGVKTTTSRPST